MIKMLLYGSQPFFGPSALSFSEIDERGVMRRPVIAGNWKMYKTQAEARAYFAAFAPLVAASTHCDIIVAPPFTALAVAVEAAKGSAISIAAQDVGWEGG